ncbi:HEAT repeat domain-containing protein [Variovorax paradoxus]|nr:HEAT repeat domain-containing protein [Variovorax paradoxus]
MKRIRSEKLIRMKPGALGASGFSTVELFALPEAPGHVVHVSTSRDGQQWKETVHTPSPLPLDAATAAFEQAVAAQIAQGYTIEGTPLATAPSASPAPVALAHPGDAVLLASLHPDSWRLLPPVRQSRVVWRIGERRLAASVPRLIDLLETGEPMLDYCIAWAIGRCGDGGAFEAMRELSQRGRTPVVTRAARWAALSLWPQDQRASEMARIADDWPAALRRAWAELLELPLEQAMPRLRDHLADTALWNGLKFAAWVEQLFELSLLEGPAADSLVHAALREIAQTLQLAAGSFRAWRRLYKGAEFAGDYVLLGVLHQRLETQRAAFRSGGRWAMANGRYVEIAKEIVRPDSRLAYSHRTRDYLRRRTWRSLRRLALAGTADEASWLQLAMGVLLAADDADAGTAGQQRDPRWSEEPGRWHTGPYSNWLVLMQLLHRHDAEWEAQRGGLRWRRHSPLPTQRIDRTEAWPERWDRHPQALLQLMQQGRCAAVHAFAARALQDNKPFCEALDAPTVWSLLASNWDDTARFALAIARQRIAAGTAPMPWLPALLRSPLAEARAYALECIARDPGLYSQQVDLLLMLLTSADADVRRASRLLLQAAASDLSTLDALCVELLAWLAASDADTPELPAICENLQWALQGLLRTAAAKAPLPELLALFDHPAAEIVATAADWLLLHPASVQGLPVAVLTRLLQSDDARLRGAGVRLFTALPDDTLLGQPELFAAFCASPMAPVRAAVAPKLAQLLPEHPAFGAALMPMLRDELFRAEAAEGVFDALLQWLRGPLAEHTRRGEPAVTLRLLEARSKGAQQLGAWLLPQQDPQGFDVLQTASLGLVDTAAARRWAMDQLAAQPERTLANLGDALRIFDSRWDDARDWARQWFGAQGNAPQWTPALLVRLCDHKDAGAQRLGRELLTTHFDVTDVTTYMLQLSQHPSPGMQLFVTNWLASAAGRKPDVLARLEPYFLSVLSQANRGRLAKARVMQFLAAQAAHSEDIARIVARVFARQAVTGAITERAQYVAGLRGIQAQFPELDNPLQTAPVRSVAPRRALPAAPGGGSAA